MKKILAMAAIFAAILCTACSKDGDSNEDFIGSWELVDVWTNSNGYGFEEKEVITFFSNGTITVESYYSMFDTNGDLLDEEYSKISTSYTYNDGVLLYKYPDSDQTASMTVEVVGDYLYLTFGNYTEQYTKVK